VRGRLTSAALLAGLVALAAPAAAAEVVITVDKSAQRMTVTVDGEARHAWPVSTGASGYATPTGSFKPLRLARSHFSREWDNAPMPHSIFFTEAGHAIHGTGAVGRLGSPASKGCVRLAGSHAATLFRLVGTAGPANTRVEIVGTEAFFEASGTGRFGAITRFDPLRDGIMAPEPRRRP